MDEVYETDKPYPSVVSKSNLKPEITNQYPVSSRFISLEFIP